MICLESELENHNAEVDSSEEVVELIKKLGGNLTSTTCYENYGSKPNTPSFYPDQSSIFVLLHPIKTKPTTVVLHQMGLVIRMN